MNFERSFRRSSPRLRGWPLDRVAVVLMVALLAASLLLVILGDHAVARVQAFSWDERTVGADDVAFTITFTRPMDPDSVEANLELTPDLPGRVSWAGRRMAYTLDAPVPYGETFRVQLPEARDRFSDAAEPSQFEAFEGTFQSRDRAVAYIGTQGDEAGRLMLLNFTEADPAIALTPPDLQVVDFEPYPLGERLLFSAVPPTTDNSVPLAPALYTVATGWKPTPPPVPLTTNRTISLQPDEAGQITPVLDSEVYQNLAFDLAPDGQKIVVQRVNQTDPVDFGPWLLAEGESPRRLETEPGGEFLIGPDSQTLLMLQGQGTAVIPLEASEADAATEPLDFLPEFGRVFDLTSDGTTAAMVNFNQNDPERRFVETLVTVTNQGKETELLDATGSIIDAEFDPTNRILYTLASELLPGEEYLEQPYLAAIALANPSTPLRLLTLPPRSRVSMDISPDGLAALLEVALPPTEEGATAPSQTVLLPLFQTTEQRLTGTPAVTTPQILSFSGARPTWLP